MQKIGVSVVICCHNSAPRLPQTLQCLANQTVRSPIRWEIVLVDNSSTDGTAEKALALWNRSEPVKMSIQLESRLGQAFARQRGLMAAEGEFVSFIDDDNRVAPDWIERVAGVMSSNPQAGACGGSVHAQLDSAAPSWFTEFQRAYAVGEQSAKPGDVTFSKAKLWGAGLTLRRRAWQELTCNGFQLALGGRQGKSLTSGDDTELCHALVLSGWKLVYDPSLRLAHHIPGQRLTWSYLRKLHRGFGRSKPVLSIYDRIARPHHSWSHRDHWVRWAGRLAKEISNDLLKLRGSPKASEGDGRILHMEMRLGALQEVVRMRGQLEKVYRNISTAPWLKSCEPQNSVCP